MANRSGRSWLWVLWGATTVTTIITTILCLVTFSNLVSADHHSGVTGVPASQLSAPVAGTLLSAIFMIALAIVSFFTLLRKSTWARAQRSAGFAYAFTAATYLNQAFFLLLTGITLTSNHRWLGALEAGDWTGGSTSAYNATYVLCFITVGVYCAMAAGLVMLKPWVQAGGEMEETGMTMTLRTGGPMSHDGAPGSSAAVAAAPGSIPSAYVDSVAAAQKSASGAW